MISTLDIINASFECAGAAAVLPSIMEAHRTKKIMGVSIITSIFFAAWGVWNIFYYPSLNQPWSAFAAVLLAAANIVWLWQVWQYRVKA